MSEKDLEIFDTILNYEKSIFILNKQLIDLDIAGKKNSKEYIDKIDLLRWIIEDEEKLLSSIKLNELSVSVFDKLLDIDENKDIIDILFEQNEEEIINLRLYNKFVKDNLQLYNSVDNFLDPLSNYYRLQNVDIKSGINDDIINVFLDALKNKIKDEKDENCKKILISIEYYLLYIYDKYDLIDNLLIIFSISDILLTKYQFTKEYRDDLILCDNLEDILNNIKSFLEIKMEYSNIPACKSESIIRLSLLESYFEFFTKNAIEEISEEIYDMIDTIDKPINENSLSAIKKLIFEKQRM